MQNCNQEIIGRRLSYSRALKIIQSEEYLDAVDLDVARREYTETGTYTNIIYTEINQNRIHFRIIADYDL